MIASTIKIIDINKSDMNRIGVNNNNDPTNATMLNFVRLFILSV